MTVGDTVIGTELLAIGAGPGGHVAATRAAQNGIDTTLVEKDAYGGTYLSYGCIPSKALITGTGLAHEVGNVEGVDTHTDSVADISQLRGWKSGVVDQLTGGVERLCKTNNVSLVEGTARFKGENAVRIAHDGGGQGPETIEFERCIVATGLRVIQIPGFDFDDEPVWPLRDILETDTVPERLVVVGGGYIGMELSTAFTKLDADVAVVEMLGDILPGYESDMARVVRKRAEKLGIDMHLGEGASG